MAAIPGLSWEANALPAPAGSMSVSVVFFIAATSSSAVMVASCVVFFETALEVDVEGGFESLVDLELAKILVKFCFLAFGGRTEEPEVADCILLAEVVSKGVSSVDSFIGDLVVGGCEIIDVVLFLFIWETFDLLVALVIEVIVVVFVLIE